MLHHCTNTILSDLNQYLQSSLSLKAPPVSLVVLSNAHVASKSPEAITMRLVDIVSVELCKNPTQYVPHRQGFTARRSPEAFNIYYLFAVDYQNASLLENLELLAYVAAFFQYKSYFDGTNTPILQEVGIQSFAVELVNITLSEKAMLWKNLGAPYTPSLLYKVGLIFVGDAAIDLKVVSPFVSRER